MIDSKARERQPKDRRYHDDVHYIDEGYREHITGFDYVRLFYLHDLYRRDYVERERKTYKEQEYRTVYRVGLRYDKIYQRHYYCVDGEEVRRQLYYEIRLDRKSVV